MSRTRRLRLVPTGFTLIELLVVIAIIGLLASIVLASLQSARAKARDAFRQSEAKQLETALEMYANDHQGTYPSIGYDSWGYNISGLATPLAPYLPKMPTDPSGYVWQYVRGPADAYGLLVYLDDGSTCRTGVNVNSGWWGTQPTCPF